MALRERYGESEALSDLLGKLADVMLFRSISREALPDIVAQLEWFCVPGGTVLFTQDEDDPSLYVVLSGRLGAFIRDEDGTEHFVRQMGAGETVGEMAVLSGQPRSATVLALRDTEIVRMPKAAFDRFIEDHPRSIHEITILLVRRLRNAPSRTAPVAAPGTLAIFTVAPGLPLADFAATLAESFAALGLVTFVIDRQAADRPIEWFVRIEEEHDLVIYAADSDSPAWSRQCLRHADRVILLVDAASALPAAAIPAVDLVRSNPRKAPIDLVLYHRQPDRRVVAPAFLDRFEGSQHHHVGAGGRRDYRHLARMIAGRAIGLVLSGGGARAFSQIGVLCALREAGIEIDLFGGTSMGAIVACTAAMGWDDKAITSVIRGGFSASKALGDYTLPLISLVRGRRVASVFREFFGDARIEDCRYPFYCVSSNLSTGRPKVHRTGPIHVALRASSAIPGILPPVVDNSDILVDGAMLNNLPIDIMVGMRRGPIVAVDVTSSYALRSTVDEIHARPLRHLLPHARRGTPNIFRLLVAATAASSYAQTRLLRDQVALMIEPPLGNIGLLDWDAFDRAVDAGYRHTQMLLLTAGERLQHTPRGRD
jgi:NTE family protein